MTRLESSLKHNKLTKSLVIGIHDWRNCLPHTLPSIIQCSNYVDETIYVLDQLSDVEQQQCRELIHAFMNLTDNQCSYRILCKGYMGWKYRTAETFNHGLSKAVGDLLYVSAEDIILDSENFNEKYWLHPKTGIVDFRYYQHNPFKPMFHVSWDNLLLKLSDRIFNYGTTRSGLFSVKHDVYDEVGGLKDRITEEDWLRKEVIEHGYHHLHVKSTRNLHLRPSYDKRRQIMQGISRRQQGVTLTRTILHSVLHFKPWVLWGYLKCGVMD